MYVRWWEGGVTALCSCDSVFCGGFDAIGGDFYCGTNALALTVGTTYTSKCTFGVAT